MSRPEQILARSRWRRGRVGGIATALTLMLSAGGGAPLHKVMAQSAVSPAPGVGAASGQAVPRFASLKSDRVNVRRGPGQEHGIDWVYRRAGLPVEVIAETEIWRRVRDSDGASGWVLGSLLSGRRTALVDPWDLKGNSQPPQVPLRQDARDASAPVAQVEAGVIASIRTCDGRWCFVAIGDFKGYIEQRRLWGVYKGESLK